MAGLKKGCAPESYKNGALDKYNLKNRTPEERKKISKMGVEARKNKINEKKKLQDCMKQLLLMELGTNSKGRALLKEYGFRGEDATNQALLMVTLFKKGLKGDVFAIKEIVDMMDRLDISNQTVTVNTDSRNININVQPVKSKENIDLEEIEEMIRIAESGEM